MQPSHVWVEQSLVAVKVTVAVPPVQAFGAAGALLVNTVLQPPVVVTPALTMQHNGH